MATLAELLDETLHAARECRWAAYRARFGALREALGEVPGADEEVAARLDVLYAAAPEQDPEGYREELEALLALLQAKGLAANTAAAPAPALDLRGLQPPEPIVRILDALARAPREPLRVVLPHEPLPLYRLLRERGFRWSGRARAGGGYELLIEAA